MTDALQRKWIALSTLTEARCQDWPCWAETQMNWSGYIWLHVKLTRILQKLRTSWIRWYCSFDIWAAAQQNQQYGLCAQWRLRSAWASTQSDQSLRRQHGESLGPDSYHWAQSKDSDQTGRMPKLIWVFAGRTFCHAFVHMKKVWVRIAIHRAYSEDSDQTGRMTIESTI